MELKEKIMAFELLGEELGLDMARGRLDRGRLEVFYARLYDGRAVFTVGPIRLARAAGLRVVGDSPRKVRHRIYTPKRESETAVVVTLDGVVELPWHDALDFAILRAVRQYVEWRAADICKEAVEDLMGRGAEPLVCRVKVTRSAVFGSLEGQGDDDE